MKKRLSYILRSMTIGGLLASAVVRLLIQFTASPVPDPASGRTEPSSFAPLISAGWQYVTPLQSLLLSLLSGFTVICLAGWLARAWMERKASGFGPHGAREFQGRRVIDRQGR